jgi:SAM-dependent methyltransferase
MNGYKNIAHIYHAMVPPLTLCGRTTANPFMAQKIATLDSGANILDAACGAGWDAIAIKNGLPAIINHPEKFNVAASDGSVYMVRQARKNAEHLKECRGLDIRQSMIRDLPLQKDWRNKFDVIIVPNAINQLHEGMNYSQYDRYMLESFQALKEVLCPSGSVLVDSRNWGETFDKHSPVTQRINQHAATTYLAEYIWTFGEQVNGPHFAEMTIWDNTEKKGRGFKEVIHFAGREVEELCAIFNAAGFDIVNRWNQLRGVHNEPFVTLELKLG